MARKQTSESDLKNRRDRLLSIISQFGDSGCSVKQLINHTGHLALYPDKPHSRREAIYCDLRFLKNEELVEKAGNLPHAQNSIKDYVWRIKQ